MKTADHGFLKLWPAMSFARLRLVLTAATTLMLLLRGFLLGCYAGEIGPQTCCLFPRGIADVPPQRAYIQQDDSVVALNLSNGQGLWTNRMAALPIFATQKTIVVVEPRFNFLVFSIISAETGELSFKFAPMNLPAPITLGPIIDPSIIKDVTAERTGLKVVISVSSIQPQGAHRAIENARPEPFQALVNLNLLERTIAVTRQTNNSVLQAYLLSERLRSVPYLRGRTLCSTGWVLTNDVVLHLEAGADSLDGKLVLIMLDLHDQESKQIVLPSRLTSDPPRVSLDGRFIFSSVQQSAAMVDTDIFDILGDAVVAKLAIAKMAEDLSLSENRLFYGVRVDSRAASKPSTALIEALALPSGRKLWDYSFLLRSEMRAKALPP